MADRIKGVTAEGTTAAKTTLFTDVLPQSMQISRPSDSSPVTDREGLTWKNEKLNSRITALPFNLPCYPWGIWAGWGDRKKGKRAVGGGNVVWKSDHARQRCKVVFCHYADCLYLRDGLRQTSCDTAVRVNICERRLLFSVNLCYTTDIISLFTP